MANPLNRVILPGERVVHTQRSMPGLSRQERTFICDHGPGMDPNDPGQFINGRWADLNAGGTIMIASWIDPEETAELQASSPLGSPAGVDDAPDATLHQPVAAGDPDPIIAQASAEFAGPASTPSGGTNWRAGDTGVDALIQRLKDTLDPGKGAARG